MMPTFRESTLTETKEMIDSNPRFSNYNREEKQILLDYAKEFIQDQADNPSAIHLKPSKSSTTLTVLKAMMSMNWYFLCTTSDHFLTNDDPVYTHRTGMGLAQGEFTFPISKNIALWATKYKKYSYDRSYQNATPRMVKEINRRTIQNATRFVFSSKKENWINQIMEKDNIQIRSRLDG